MPIVDGKPGHHTHPNRRFASPPPPAHQFEMHDGTKGPKQSSHTPFPSINAVGRWPQYPGAASPDWLHLKDPQKGLLLLETGSRLLRGRRPVVGVEKTLAERLDRVSGLAAQALGKNVAAAAAVGSKITTTVTPVVGGRGAVVSRTSKGAGAEVGAQTTTATTVTTGFHSDRSAPLWQQVKELEDAEKEGPRDP